MRTVYFLVFVLILVSCRNQVVAEEDIVLINADTLDRDGIARALDAINALDPKLVAIDLQFSGKSDPRKDIMLRQALRTTKNLLMVSVIDNFGDGMGVHYEQFTLGSAPVFLTHAKTGFANTIIEENEMRTLNRFSTHAYVAGQIEYHFGVRVAMAFDSLRAIRYLQQRPRIVDVDYRNGERRFKVFNPADIFTNDVFRKDIAGKIVMLGFLGPGNEDKFYTPLNTNPDEPDTYGLEYLAHIVAQILDNE